MSRPADIAAPEAVLGELAQLALAVARDLGGRMAAAENTDQVVRIAEAFTRVSRCVRMCIALAMRLRRGDPAVRAQREDREPDLDIEREDRDDFDQPPEGLERESLYDRLPAGDLPAQVATIARALNAAVRVLPADAARAYRGRCQALMRTASAAAIALPDEPPDLDRDRRRGPATVIALPRVRGPPPA